MLDFTPKADPVTGGTAVAKLITIDPPLKPLKAGETSTTTVKVFFDIIKAGSYYFEATDPSTIKGTTTGLSVQPMKGNFDTIETDKTLDFTITGMPKTSLEGNSLAVSKAVTLNTGAIQFDSTPIEGNIPLGPNAFCSPTDKTTVAPILSLKTGRVWMDRNLGASRVAESLDDFNAFGCLYQWGRGNDGHASINWTSVTTGRFINGTTPGPTNGSPGSVFIANNNILPYGWQTTPDATLWQGVNGTNNPCPPDYRVPIIAELRAEVTGATNATDAYSSPLKLVFSKYSTRNATIRPFSYVDGGSINWYGGYWSNSIIINSDYFVYDLFFSDSDFYPNDSSSTVDGFSVRCIKN